METRQITQVKVWKLCLNPMTDRTEASHLVAWSIEEGAIEVWYKSQLVPTYKDDHWVKNFKQGSPLEWYNPANIVTELDHYGQGLSWEWVEESIVPNITIGVRV